MLYSVLAMFHALLLYCHPQAAGKKQPRRRGRTSLYSSLVHNEVEHLYLEQGSVPKLIEGETISLAALFGYDTNRIGLTGKNYHHLRGENAGHLVVMLYCFTILRL